MASKKKIIREEIKLWFEQNLIDLHLYNLLWERYKEGKWNLAVTVKRCLIAGLMLERQLVRKNDVTINEVKV